MLLKRLYDRSDPEKPKINGVKILRHKNRQNFSPDLIHKGAGQGWLTFADGKITIKAENETLTYSVVRGPGYYCCHCGVDLGDAGAILEAGLTAGLKHVRDAHPGKASPDLGNPSGYCRLNHYETVLDAAQQPKPRAKSGGRR